MKRRLNRVSACKALLCFMAFGLASSLVSAAPVISATKKDTISNDVNGDTNANPGDTLKYEVKIQNTGDMSGTNVQFTDTLDGNTTLVPGSVTVTPIAANDNYSISGNTTIDSMFISAANGLLANDFDPNGGGAGGTCTGGICSVTPQTGLATTPAGTGTVDIMGDGSFEYFPAPGNSTTATFTYTITDAEGKTDTGTVSIMFTEVIWYVDNTKPPGGNGTSGSPFNNLADAAAASGTGHMIYVLSGTGITGPNTGITLDPNESLVGQGVDLVVDFNGTDNKTLFPAGTPPVIGTPVTLAQDNTIKGLNIGNSSNPVAGTGILGNNYGTLTVSDASVTTSGGPALNLATGTLGTMAAPASFASLSSTNSSGRGLSITGSAGTLSITGATAISTPVTQGVFLSSNTGTFNFAGMNITNTGNTGFSASSGGTVNVTGTGNFVDTTTGTALNLTSTTIGANGLHFQRISASGGTNGIVLNTTGTSGGLTVTGTGTAGSGGTIQSTTGDGVSLSSAILLSNTQSPSFNNMNIQTTGGSGIQGTQVVNFSFTNGRIDNSGTGGGTNDSNIALNAGQGVVGATNQNVSGTLTITGNTLTNAQFHGLDIYNFNGTLSAVTISNNVIQSSAVAALSQGSGIRLIADSSTTTAAHVTQATLSNNQIRNFPQGAGILMQANSSIGGPAANLGTAGSLTNVISVTGNLISGDATDPMATQGVVAVVNRAGQGNFDISGNGTAADRIRNMAGAGLAVSAFGNVTVTANVNNNFVAPSNLFASNGIAIGLDSVDALTDAPNLTANVNGNTITQTDGNGILTTARNSNGTLRVKIQNNNVAAPLTGVRPGIRVDSGSAAGDTDLCLNISGNTSAGSGGSQGMGLRKQGTDPAVDTFSVNGMAATSSPGVEAFVDGLNPAGGGTLLISATSGFSSCSLP